MMKKFIGIFFLIFNIGLYAEGENIIVPMIPLLPSMPANPEARRENQCLLKQKQ